MRCISRAVVLLKGKVAQGRRLAQSRLGGALQRLIDSRDAHLVAVFMEIDVLAGLLHMGCLQHLPICMLHLETKGYARASSRPERQSWCSCWPPSPPSVLCCWCSVH